MSHTFRLNFLLLLVVTSVLTAGTAWWMSTHKPFDDAPDRPADTDLVHGNDDRNDRLHIVYEIYAISPAGKPITLKYGISGQKNFVTKWGNPRPEYQIPFYKGKKIYKAYMIAYKILHRNIPGRVEAKKIERKYVNRYYSKHGVQPAEQLRPLPDLLKTIRNYGK